MTGRKSSFEMWERFHDDDNDEREANNRELGRLCKAENRWRRQQQSKEESPQRRSLRIRDPGKRGRWTKIFLFKSEKYFKFILISSVRLQQCAHSNVCGSRTHTHLHPYIFNFRPTFKRQREWVRERENLIGRERGQDRERQGVWMLTLPKVFVSCPQFFVCVDKVNKPARLQLTN